MESYEVVIVGAGPGGLTCAQYLAEHGRKVLLLEQNSEIGPKVCAGGLTGHSIEHFRIPRDLFDYQFKEISLHTPLQSRVFKLGEPYTNTIDRKNLGQWQLRKLQKTSAKIRTNAKVNKIFKDHIIVNNSEEIRYKYLIGADGTNSLVRRFVGLKTKNLVIAIQYIVPGDTYKKFEMFLAPKLFSVGYAWIFPHKGYASIGCGCEPSVFSSKELMANFEIWLKQRNIDISKAKYEAFPISYDYQGYKFGNVYLIGDAAGLASGLTGGGIHQAMVSGEEAAKSIINKDYVSRRMEEVLESNNKQNGTLRFMMKTKYVMRFELEAFLLLMKSETINKHLVKMIM